MPRLRYTLLLAALCGALLLGGCVSPKPGETDPATGVRVKKPHVPGAYRGLSAWKTKNPGVPEPPRLQPMNHLGQIMPDVYHWNPKTRVWDCTTCAQPRSRGFAPPSDKEMSYYEERKERMAAGKDGQPGQAGPETAEADAAEADDQDDGGGDGH